MRKHDMVIAVLYVWLVITVNTIGCYLVKEATIEESPAPINYKRETQDPLSESKRFTYERERNQKGTDKYNGATQAPRLGVSC